MEQQDWIRLEDAVSLIAKYCYPDQDNPRNTKNKARRRIKYATDNRLLIRFPDGRSWKFNKDEFLQWAVNKWPELIDHVSFSVSVDLQGAAAAAKAGELSGRVDIIPSDPRELQDLLKQCRDELGELKAEIHRLKPFAEKWQAEEKKKQDRRKNASDAGKKGGRGKST